MAAWMDGWMDGWMGGRTDGWMEGWMDGSKAGEMQGWKERRTEGRMDYDCQVLLLSTTTLYHSRRFARQGEPGIEPSVPKIMRWMTWRRLGRMLDFVRKLSDKKRLT